MANISDDNGSDIFMLHDEVTGKYIMLLKANGIPHHLDLTDSPLYAFEHSGSGSAQIMLDRITEGLAQERVEMAYASLPKEVRLEIVPSVNGAVSAVRSSL